MATYNSAAEREANQRWEQQRMAQMNPEGYAPGATNPAATPTDPNAPPPATPQAGGAVNGAPPSTGKLVGGTPWSPPGTPGIESNSSTAFGKPKWNSGGTTAQPFSAGESFTGSVRPVQNAAQPGFSTTPMGSVTDQAPDYSKGGIQNLSRTPMDSMNDMTGGASPKNPGTAPPWLQPQPMAAPPQVGTGGGNPGVSLGSQEAFAGGPEVTLSRANADGLPGLAAGLDLNGMPKLSGGLDTSKFAGLDLDFNDAAKRGADAAYKGATQYFDEDFGRDTQAMRTQLINQGLTEGSAAYNSEMSRLQRGQDQARTGAALQAQQVGHSQAGDMLMRALQSRQQMAAEQGQNAGMALGARGALTGEQLASAGLASNARGQLTGERERDADRMFGQSMGVAGLGMTARGQDMGQNAALQANSTQAAAAANAASNTRYGIDTNRDLSLRGLGLQQDQMDFNQLLQLIGGARGGVNMPNFGGAQPLDVGGANQIASSNNNAQENRDAADRQALANLGATALGNVNWGQIFTNGY